MRQNRDETDNYDSERRSQFSFRVQVFVFSRKGAKRNHDPRNNFAPLRLCGRTQSFGVRGFALSPEAAAGNGGNVSPSFAGVNGVAVCRLPSSNLLNSANSLSASSFFFNRE